MKKVLFNLAVFIMLFGALAGATLAGNTSYSIAVSCTIPAIPGVNVPLIEENTLSAATQIAVNAQEEQMPVAQEQQIEKEQLLGSENGDSLMLTRTIYSR